MQANAHTPQRLAGESQQQYKFRRAESHTINAAPGRFLFVVGKSKFYSWETGKARRAAIKQCGGIRQLKRLRRAFSA